MPVIKSAKKKLRQDKKRSARNNLLRIVLKQVLKKAHKNPTEAVVRQAVKTTDKAAKQKIIHKNKAARIKSKLSKLTVAKTQTTSRKKAPAKKAKKT